MQPGCMVNRLLAVPALGNPEGSNTTEPALSAVVTPVLVGPSKNLSTDPSESLPSPLGSNTTAHASQAVVVVLHTFAFKLVLVLLGAIGHTETGVPRRMASVRAR